jgi:hypothetical protein
LRHEMEASSSLMACSRISRMAAEAGML